MDFDNASMFNTKDSLQKMNFYVQICSLRWCYVGDGRLPGCGDGRSAARRAGRAAGGRVLAAAHRAAVPQADLEGAHLL